MKYHDTYRHRENVKTYVWTNQSSKNILTDESYTGVLINHRRESKEGTNRYVPEKSWVQYEGASLPGAD